MGQNYRDGIMSWFAFFEKNLPIGTGRLDYGALDAINAEIELRENFQNFKNRMKSECEINGINLDFNIKCGINTGQVHIGLVYVQFTAMGPNLNLASRLQEFANGGQIIISNSTRDKICWKGNDLRRISVDLKNPIKSFEDIDCCYEILL
ncbi:MAG TPA: adenylate/guanylate cyclase domain-containing protein [Candidatus Nitrosocosmicus sp.]|nr:adenylate/guanylate cyclase domain-containing protein [Candidatus Nitrosocosmicus sp.]